MMKGDSAPSKENTLSALRQTSKGRLKYHISLEDVDIPKTEYEPNSFTTSGLISPKNPPTFPKTGNVSTRRVSENGSSRALTAAEVESRNEIPATINSLYDDDEEDSTARVTRSFFLDQDNYNRRETNVTAKPPNQSLNQSLTTNEDIVEDASSQSSSTKESETSISCSSVEGTTLRRIKAEQERQSQNRITLKQLKVVEGFEAINNEFNQRFDELRITQEIAEMNSSRQWEEELELSRQLYSEKEEQMRRESEASVQILNTSLEKVRLEQKKEAEKRVQAERLADKKKQKEKEQIRAECDNLLSQLNDVAIMLYEAFDTIESYNIEVTRSFLESGRRCTAQIMDSVKAYSTRPISSSVGKLKECLKTLNSLRGTVTEHEKVAAESKRRQSEREQQLLQQQHHQQEQEQQRLQQQQQHQHIQQQQHAQQQQLSQQKLTQQQTSQQEHMQQHQHSQQHQPSNRVTLEPKSLTDLCCHEDTYLEFVRVSKMVMEFQEAGKRLSAMNAQAKKLRIELQKAISITVNSISAQSTAHIKQKLETLTSLINGGSVNIGNATVSAHGHQDAVVMCKSLIAKKLVEQADIQVSANPKAAFPFAQVMVSLMNDSPEMKDLILGYFYIQCPFLVPYYPAKQQDQTTIEYYSSLGYKVSSSGDIEQQDLYIKRITGYTKLFASCLISKGVGGRHNTILSLEQGWLWLSRIVNLHPRPCITSTVLCGLLSVVGSELPRVYGRQGHKLLIFLLDQFVPTIRAITDEQTDGGATEKLNLLLSELVQTFGRRRY